MCSAKLVLGVRVKGNARVPLKKHERTGDISDSTSLGEKERDKAS